MSRHHKGLDRRRLARWRLAVLERDGWRCARCGGYANECDHCQPLHKGGDPYSLENGQALCGGAGGCHAAKTAAENRRELTPAERAWADFVAELRG